MATKVGIPNEVSNEEIRAQVHERTEKAHARIENARRRFNRFIEREAEMIVLTAYQNEVTRCSRELREAHGIDLYSA